MGNEIIALSATELLRHYRHGSLSPLEVTRAVLARIEQLNDAFVAFVFVDAEGALATARESEQRWREGRPIGLLDGVPTTIKDVVLTKGWTARYGSLTTEPDNPSPFDAPATARLREQGVVLIGITASPEFGWKGVTDSRLAGITRNPWDPSRTPGGSSGGAAAAAALGMGALHVGTDGGGSIRIPAGFTGVYGHKPCYGRVPAFPLSPFGTVAHVGPMARCVADLALMLTVMAQPDARDPHGLPWSGLDYRIGLDDGLAGLKIGYSPDLGYAQVHPEVAARVADAVGRLAELGAVVEQVEPPFANPLEIFQIHWYAGAARRFSQIPEEKRDQVDPGFREIVTLGQQITLPDYLEAVAERGALARAMQDFHERYDLLVTPSVAIPAFTAGLELPEPDGERRWMDWTPFSQPFNLTQQPACSLPCGLTADGLPVGLQVVGPRYDDALVLRAARAYESLHPFQAPPEPASS